MLSFPHMIVLFLVVLVVFGPQKLPELARGLGKLMAEFRKASMDFRSAFEQEMRDIERQAFIAERKKVAEAAPALTQPANEPTCDTVQSPISSGEASLRATELPQIASAPGSVPRSVETPKEAAPEAGSAESDGSPNAESPATLGHSSHDQQQPV